MSERKQQRDIGTSVDDVYLGELAARVAQHERAEFARARRLIAEQEKQAGIAERPFFDSPRIAQ